MNNTTSLIKEKKARLDIIENLLKELDNEEQYVGKKYVWYDTEEPRLDKDGNIRYNDDGTIIYKQDCRTEQKSEDELDDDDKARLMAIQTLRNQLEKMI